MKRKRKSASTTIVGKRRRLSDEPDPNTCDHPTIQLLRQFYPGVTSLRQYLISRLPRASKKRRRRILQYGLSTDAKTSAEHDPDVANLLDSVMVGASTEIAAQTLDSSINEEVTVFTQQLSEASETASPTPGALKQAEIVDFTIWSLFRKHAGSRRPAHILCHTFQQTTHATDGVEPVVVPRIPGVLSNGVNPYVSRLKTRPWTALPKLLGRNAERVLTNMLIECGLFVPVDKSSNLKQISGTPLSGLKGFHYNKTRSGKALTNDAASSHGNTKVPVHVRSLSDIRFLRHRMLYAKCSLTATGRIRFGLNHPHVLGRFRNLSDDSETIHVMKYIFPRQFGLHNVFTSAVDLKDTSQPLKDYTLREQEIQKIMLRHRAIKHTADRALPRRLRGEAFRLISRLRRRDTRCSYAALLNYYCPSMPTDPDLKVGSFERASPSSQVSAFCRAVVANVFPLDIFGTGEMGTSNRTTVGKNIDQFIHMRRYETTSLHDVTNGMSIKAIKWLEPPDLDGSCKMSATDYSKRKEILAELLYYLFDSFLVPLIRSHFHVTESNVHRNQIFYFRHDVWRSMSEPALRSLRLTMLEECNSADVKKALGKRSLGVSQVRLLPKAQGMRPIINLRRRMQRQQYGGVVLGRSINSILTPAFSILNFEKNARPDMLGSALFSVDDIFSRLQAFRHSLKQQGLTGKPLYFAKLDVQSCFDTIPQKELMKLVRRIVSSDDYQTTRYSRAGLIGGHNPETPGFGAKPSWRFLTKASTEAQPFDFDAEVRRDTTDGRTRTVFVDGVMKRTERRGAILDLLQEHVESNLIKLGNHFYRQREGIPQGSIVSSLLCSYFYAELEREALSFLDNGQTLLLRLIDDFLVITTEKSIAEKFMHVMHAGIPQFGVHVKAEKSLANFEVNIRGQQIAQLPSLSDFPYCGNIINTLTLDISKDKERRRAGHPAETITVELSTLPGQSFYRKTLNALKLQMHAMLLSTRHNDIETVLSNLYHTFFEVAQKSYHYIRSLPLAKQPSGTLTIRAVDDLIKLACMLMKRRKTSSKDRFPYECAVTSAQARWLACAAFMHVFRRRQTKHSQLLAWLSRQIEESGALKAQSRRLKPVVERYHRY